MGNVLSFTIGLEVQDALRKLGVTAKEFLSLATVGKALEQVWEKTWGTIEAGAELEKLSRRTGQTVSDLYELQKGFERAGLSAGDLPTVLFMMQKSLGGVNEMGQKTEDVFQRMGLKASDLKEKSAPEQFDAILTAMSKLGESDAAKAASSVFGRGQGANMKELSRSMGEFHQGMKDAANTSYVFERVAAVFRSIEMSLGRVKDKLTPIWLAFAELVAPAVQKVLDLINQIDVEGIANGLRRIFANIGEAFKEGNLYELVTMTFEAAVERFGNVLFGLLGNPALWSAIWQYAVGEFQIKYAVLGKMLLGLGTILAAGFDTAFQVLFAWIGRIPKVGKMLGLEGYTAKPFAENYAERRKAEAGPQEKWFNELFKSGKGNVEGSWDSFKKAFGDAQGKGGGPAQDALRSFLDSLTERAGPLPANEPGKIKKGKDAGDHLDAPGGSNYRPDFTSVEKMGFVMSGLGNPMMTPLNSIAASTRQLVELAKSGAQGGDGSMVHEPM